MKSITTAAAAALFLLAGNQNVASQSITGAHIGASKGGCSYEGVWTNHGDRYRGKTQDCLCQDQEWTDCKKIGAEVKKATPQLQQTFGVPPTRRDFVDSFRTNEYVFDLANSVGERGAGGTIQPANVGNWPVLSGHGTSASLFTLEPCGINLPHSHPRATEMLYVIEAEALRVTFVGENGAGIKANDVCSGELTFFPQGLMHYQQNLSCKPATYISILNSADPGVITVAPQFFQFDDLALEASVNLGPSDLNVINKGLPDGPGAGVQQCLKRCGLLNTRKTEGGRW